MHPRLETGIDEKIKSIKKMTILSSTFSDAAKENWV